MVHNWKVFIILLGKTWQAVLDQGIGKMWKRPGSGPEGTVQLLAEAAITLKDRTPVTFCQRGPPSKGSRATAVPAGQQAFKTQACGGHPYCS